MTNVSFSRAFRAEMEFKPAEREFKICCKSPNDSRVDHSALTQFPSSASSSIPSRTASAPTTRTLPSES